MRPIQRVIHAGFATAAIASAAVPALAWTVWPDVDFEWYANVGRVPAAAQPVSVVVARGDDLRAATRWDAGRAPPVTREAIAEPPARDRGGESMAMRERDERANALGRADTPESRTR